MSVNQCEATKPASNYQVEMQVAAYLLSLARQRTSEMECAVEAAGVLVTHLQKQNELLYFRA